MQQQTLVLFVRYLWRILVHKYFILIAGFHVNRILASTSYRVSYQRLFRHDLSKLSSIEFWPYAKHFYGDRNKKNDDDEFHRAWLHHAEYNDHHWEYFIPNYVQMAKQLSTHILPREMPDDALLEMIVDNLAASRSYDGFWPDGKKNYAWLWMTCAFDRIVLHPVTRLKYAALLSALGYARVLPNSIDWTSIETVIISDEDRIKLKQLQQLAELTN